MTRTVVATFADAEAARRAAVALGRAELAAGPTRVQVDASAPGRGARLELRVDEPDAPRAIALMREHGAAVADHDGARDLRGGGPLAAWGMAVADAVTAAMGGASASDAQVPVHDPEPRVEAAPHPEAGDAPAGTSVPARRRGTITDAQRDAVARDAARQDRDAAAPRRRPRAPGTSAPTDAAGDPPTAGDEAAAPRAGSGAARTDGTGRPAAPVVVWGNAPSRGPAGSGSGTHLSDTVAAGTASSMGQVGPGSTIAAAMGATDGTGTASGTRTRAAPEALERADDVPTRDPRPPRRRPKSEA